MKRKSKKQQLKKKSEFRYHVVTILRENKTPVRIRHPAYIFLVKGNLYIYVTLTHSKTIKNIIVVELRDNPNSNDNRKSYWVMEIKQDTKDTFGKVEKDWKIKKEDDNDIRVFFQKEKDDSADRD